MRYLMGLVLTGGMILIGATESRAQFGLSIGNPYSGQGIVIGTPAYGYSSGYYGYGAPAYSYSSGYSGYNGYGVPGYYNTTNYYSNTGYLAGPGAFAYSSGYRGYVAPVTPYVYRDRPYYGGYGYGGYGYGVRPFRGGGRMFR